MRQTGTDYQRILSIFRDVWDTAEIYRNNPLQRQLTITGKINELCEFLDIEFEAGEVVSIAGKEVG